MSLKKQVEDIIQIKIENLKDNDKLIELGLDSIKLVELAGLIEGNTDLVIYEDKIYKIDGKWIKDILIKYDTKKN